MTSVSGLGNSVLMLRPESVGVGEPLSARLCLPGLLRMDGGRSLLV